MVHGESQVREHWYFFDDDSSSSNGQVVYGWKYLSSSGGKWVYYQQGLGVMLYGEQHIDGAWYYLDPVTGARKSGWQRLKSNGGKTVYYGADGKMQYGTQYINGRLYYFDSVTGAKR